MAESQIDPIWEVMEEQGRSLVWLAKVTGYSESHVRNVKARVYRATPEFRAACARALQLREHHLFLDVPRAREVAAGG